MRTASRSMGYANREVTQPPDWHFLVELDVFLNAVTTGVFLVAAVAELCRPSMFADLTRWVYPVALVALLADLACLVLDLGNPARFHHMLRVFKPLSPMSLGTWCLTAYSLPLTLLVAVDLLGGPRWLHMTLIVIALPFAFGSAAYKGVLFSTTAQPGWRDARWLGAFHTTGALLIGGAGLLLAVSIASDTAAADLLRPALVALIILNLITLGLLVRELGLTLDRAFPGGAAGGAVLLVGFALPIFLIIGGGVPASVIATILIPFGGFAVRSAIVRLPHLVR